MCSRQNHHEHFYKIDAVITVLSKLCDYDQQKQPGGAQDNMYDVAFHCKKMCTIMWQSEAI